jgi:hypothetical protein
VVPTRDNEVVGAGDPEALGASGNLGVAESKRLRHCLLSAVKKRGTHRRVGHLALSPPGLALALTSWLACRTLSAGPVGLPRTEG